MLIDMKCPNCGAIIQFDNAQTTMFCPYCGCKVAKAVQPDKQSAQQTNYSYNQRPQNLENTVPVTSPQNSRKAKSPLSIVAFILSFTVLLSWMGAVLGIVDAFATDKKKVRNHVLAYWAIGIGLTIVLLNIYSLMGGDNTIQNQNTIISSNGIVTKNSSSPTFYDGTLNLEVVEAMEKVASGEKYTIYDENFYDHIIEAKWWSSNSSMDKPGNYNADTETLSFSIEVFENVENDIYYAYYYSKDIEFDKNDLSRPLFKDTISPIKNVDGRVFYNIDCTRNIQKGYYVVVVASDKNLQTPYIVAYADVN